MKGYISTTNKYGVISVRVDGYCERWYDGYTMLEAVKKYRELTGLKGKHITFYVM